MKKIAVKNWFFDYGKLYLYLLVALLPTWRLLKLTWWAVLLVGLFVAIMIPLHRKKYKEEQAQILRVTEVSQYMDSMLYAFQKEAKIVNSLEDVCASLGPGNIKTLVEKSRNYVEMTFDEVNVFEKGLGMIYGEYPSRRVRNLHDFMIHVENFGGDIKAPIDLMLQEKEMWELRMKGIIADRKKMFRDIALSILASLIICSFVLYLPAGNFDASKSVLSQIMTVLLIIADEMILLRGQRFLSVDWIRSEWDENDDYYANKMKEWKSWNRGTEAKKSFVLAAIMFLASALAFAFHIFWLGCMGFFFTLIAGSQHLIGRRLQKKKLMAEIRRAFPVWLMDLVLLLQSENVSNALNKSYIHAPGVLKSELKLLIDRIEMEPENAGPYHKFLEDFDVPEIHSAMNLLYAMSVGQGGSVEQQIGNLIRRNQEMQNVAEKQKDEDRTAGMYLLFLAPVLTGAVKLLVDMALFLISFLSFAVS